MNIYHEEAKVLAMIDKVSDYSKDVFDNAEEYINSVVDFLGDGQSTKKLLSEKLLTYVVEQNPDKIITVMVDLLSDKEIFDILDSIVKDEGGVITEEKRII
jgi:hypothetical protein